MDFWAKKYILKVSFNIAKYPDYYGTYNLIYYLLAIRLHRSSLVSCYICPLYIVAVFLSVFSHICSNVLFTRNMPALFKLGV